VSLLRAVTDPRWTAVAIAGPRLHDLAVAEAEIVAGLPLLPRVH